MKPCANGACREHVSDGTELCRTCRHRLSWATRHQLTTAERETKERRPMAARRWRTALDEALKELAA